MSVRAPSVVWLGCGYVTKQWHPAANEWWSGGGPDDLATSEIAAPSRTMGGHCGPGRRCCDAGVHRRRDRIRGPGRDCWLLLVGRRGGVHAGGGLDHCPHRWEPSGLGFLSDRVGSARRRRRGLLGRPGLRGGGGHWWRFVAGMVRSGRISHALVSDRAPRVTTMAVGRLARFLGAADSSELRMSPIRSAPKVEIPAPAGSTTRSGSTVCPTRNSDPFQGSTSRFWGCLCCSRRCRSLSGW